MNTLVHQASAYLWLIGIQRMDRILGSIVPDFWANPVWE